MNESNFAGLKYFPDQRLNIRQIENIDTKSILRGNVKDLLGVMNDLAYIDVENDEYVGGTPEAKKLYRLCQYGLQYMMYTVTKLGDNTLLLRDYLQIQDDKKKKLQELVNSQEETLRNLRQKKKTLQDTEKNYQNLLKTLNLENSSADPRELRRFASFDSDPEGKEGSVPLHLPKGPHKRNQSREKSPGVSISYSNAQTGGPQNAGYDPRGYQQDPNYQSAQQYPPQYGAPQNANYQYPPQYGTSQPVNYQQQQPNQPVNYQYPPYGTAQPVNYQQQQQPNRDIRETPRTEDNFQPNVPPRAQNETPPRTFNDYPAYQGQPAAVNRPGTSYGYEPASKGPEEQEAHKETDDRKFNQYTAGTVNNAQIRGPEPKKDDYDDDYEEDFELSESYVPDNSKIPSRFGKNRVGQNVLGSLGNSEKKPGDPEDTISMDFDKEFGKNYLDNLDRLVTKNKPGVEVPVKKYS